MKTKVLWLTLPWVRRLLLLVALVFVSLLCMICRILGDPDRALLMPDHEMCYADAPYVFRGRVVSSVSLQGVDGAEVQIASGGDRLSCTFPGRISTISLVTDSDGYFSTEGGYLLDPSERLVIEVKRMGCSTYVDNDLDRNQFRSFREVEASTDIFQIYIECPNE